MMTFLSGVAASVVEWLLTKGFALFLKDYEQYKANKKAASDAKAKADALKNATTTDEIDKATDGSLDNL